MSGVITILSRRLSLIFCLLATFSVATVLLPAPVRADNTPSTVVRGDADDTITIVLGNYLVDGGGGNDMLVLPLFPNEYEFIPTGANQYLVKCRETTIIVKNVEQIEFGSYYQTQRPVDELSSGKDQIQLARLTDLYLAFFGRAPDVKVMIVQPPQ